MRHTVEDKAFALGVSWIGTGEPRDASPIPELEVPVEGKPFDRIGIYRLKVAEIPLDKEQRL